MNAHDIVSFRLIYSDSWENGDLPPSILRKAAIGYMAQINNDGWRIRLNLRNGQRVNITKIKTALTGPGYKRKRFE